MSFTQFWRSLFHRVHTPRLDFSGDIPHALECIRAYCQQVGKFSWTSREYQEAIFATLVDINEIDGPVIEIGCYKGGLSAQIAYMCHRFNKKFVYIDIDSCLLNDTTQLLKALKLHAHAEPFLGTFQDYFSRGVQQTPSLVIVDGDHEYEAAKRDIETILRLSPHPAYVVFHDYSLRSPHTGENVQKAIEEFLPGYPQTLIGTQFNGSGHPTEDAHQEDGHYWAHPGAEGAKVRLRQW